MTLAFNGLNLDGSVELDLASEELHQNWKKYVSEWATRPPFYLTSGGRPYTVVCGRYQDHVEILNDRERFTTIVPDLPGYERYDMFKGNKDIMHVDNADHDRVRRLLNPAFAPSAVAKYEESIKRISNQMLDDVEALGGKFDAFNDYAKHLVDRVLLEGALGFNPEQRSVFVRMYDSFALVKHIAPGQPYPDEYMQDFQAAVKTITEIIASKKANPGDDFVSRLVMAREEGDKLSDEELFGNLFAICAAGLGTTAISMATALLTLCRHPEQMKELQENPELIPMALEECLRYHGPSYGAFARFAHFDTEVAGTKIPKNMPVQLSWHAANFDPMQFPEPLKFDIHRDPKRTMQFGMVHHHCIGNRMARRILQINLENVLRRFPKLHLLEPDREPVWGGMMGELVPDRILMGIH